jgi:16S rRNA (cytidine1402-2'-O)-methyltransferase
LPPHRKKSRNSSYAAAPHAPLPESESLLEPSAADEEGKSSAPGPQPVREGGQKIRTQSELRQSLAPGLYVTATPIGNAADITLRALNVLCHCDAIVAEDTRVTSRLLAIHGISRPLLCYNDHNGPSMRPKLLAKLAAGARLALVSDAGTPLVSDPGHKLVRAAREAGIAVHPIPGASAVLAALAIVGLPTDHFFFAGFLSSKQGERRTALSRFAAVPGTLVFYESAHRLAEALADMAEILGPREAAVARELTKLHEEVRHGTLDALATYYGTSPPPKGEITLLVGPPSAKDALPDAEIDALLEQALRFMPVSAASALIAQAGKLPRRAVYARALALQAKSPEGSDGAPS